MSTATNATNNDRLIEFMVLYIGESFSSQGAVRAELLTNIRFRLPQFTGMVTTVVPALPAGKRRPRAMRTAVEP